ncbi:putative leucine-rich repeat-containing protein DDB_G0290503 [Bombus impatiens]|uniref:Leucine-rich repeat-containing protein DDB_G0290503 n=1 Tax=Bombus impatiens TaxID=132113 RepID=A0A6P3DQ92_BOMIM|nr:putative leucine-rich repeat-containing protein DDB_G0290503 [Bombus impatiens]
MKLWIGVLLEWLNCLDILETNVKDLKELDNGKVYKKLIKSFSWTGTKDSTDTENIIVKYLQDEYPKYKFDKNLEEMEHIYIASLFLLLVPQEPSFHHQMCFNLQHETQLKIKSFLEMTIPYKKDINKETLKEIIARIENDASKIPVTPKGKALKNFFDSPVTWSAQNHKLLNDRNRELRMLKSELEVERFEKIDLQEDIRIQQNKIQSLQKKLQEKTAEIKVLREEKMKPTTPQSCKKNKGTIDYEQYYRKEIDHLEDQLLQKQCNIDKLEADADTLTKKLTSIQMQYIYFRDKVENCEKSLENMQIQGEIKDRELVNLKKTNEELRTHLKELRKTTIEEQSFEIDDIVPLNSSSASLNTSEVLSSVIDIQLQEAKEESALLKTQLDVVNEKLKSANQEYESTTQLLKKERQILQSTETKLNVIISESTKQIETLQQEKESLIKQNKNLEMLYTSQKETLSVIEKSKGVLITEKNSLLGKIKDLEESLNKENINNVKLNTELTEVKAQISENLKYIQDIKDQNSSYKTSVDLYNTNLKEIILHNLETDCVEDKLDNKTTTELIECLRIILYNFNQKYTLKQLELESLSNNMNEAKLKLENFQLQISKLEQKDEQNTTEISKLRKTVAESTTKIKELTNVTEKYSEEISYLKQIELQKQTLEKVIYVYEEKVNKKDALLQTSSKYIETLKKNIRTFESEFYLMKKDILNQINEYKKYNEKTTKSILNAYKILYTNYTKEQLSMYQLKDELTDNKKKLEDSISFNVMLENDLIKNKEITNHLETELICTKQKLTEFTQKLEKFEEVQEVFQKQHKDLKSENNKILLDLNNVNDKFEKSQQEVCNMLDEFKFKDKKIENLTDEITSLKLEKDHIMHLQTEGEIKMKDFIKELETKLLEKQCHLDKLNIEVKLKQETLELVENKFEKLSKETIASEVKLKEVIINLQEVRTNQDAVLKTQEKALKEKCLQLEELQKEFNESKRVLCKQLEDQKLLCQNLQSTNFKLQTESYKQNKIIEELQQILKKEKDELNKNREYCKIEDAKRLEVIQICEELQHSANGLKFTIAEVTKNENSYINTTDNVQDINNDDTNKNILRTLKESINEIQVSRELILQLSNENTNLNKTLKNQTVMVDNYITKCEEIKLLEIKIQELNNLQEDHIKRINTFIKYKESLKDYLNNIIKSRENLDTSLNTLKQKWDNLLTSSYSVLMIDKSACDELKHIQSKQTYLENTLLKYHIHHFQNIKPLQNILWDQFLWFEQKIKDISLKEESEQILDISSDIFFDQKTIIEAELVKNKILQENVTQLQNEIDDFSKLVISFENDFKCDETKFQSESEKKLRFQINELTEAKNNLESKLNCAHTNNVRLKGDIGELSIKVQEMETSLKEIENLKKEATQLKEQNLKLQEERNELSKRSKKEDIDIQLKDIHDKYKVKIDEIKQNMKMLYNEQITKLNREQEQCVQEKLESLQRKMELQCRKQADELSKYKVHVANLSSQLWSIGERLLSEKQEKEKLQKELIELKTKYQNLDQNIVSLMEHKNPKCEKKYLLGETKEDVLHKISVIQERTTYEKRCSIKSIQTMGNAFNAEDEEGEVLDNIYLADMKDGNSSQIIDADRLSILKKRNALCKPHLKSSYPVEMQFHSLPFTEEEIKAGSVPDDTFNDSLSQSLLPEQKAKKKDRTQTSYKKPGPPTPSKNGGRLSIQGNELRSPNSRILRERNGKERATTTPRTLRSLFLPRGQDEKVIVTPRGRRRSSIFRKYRNANDR